ncbi:MAG TPA: hypothetical protein VGF48_02370 [Thermoanaerobaculia bacterium]|jgi:hypothetical protein
MPVTDVKWVIVEVPPPGSEESLFVWPLKLYLERGYTGEIVWYVFTEGWQLAHEHAVVFLDSAALFSGHPQPDPSRPNCWSATVSSPNGGTFHYTLHVVTPPAVTEVHRRSIDPVVESEPPPNEEPPEERRDHSSPA